MSTDGDDPKDKGRPQPPSTLAGVVPQPPRPGLPPPRSTHGGPRAGSQSQAPFGAKTPAPFSQRPLSPSSPAAGPSDSQVGAPSQGHPAAPSQGHAAPSQGHAAPSQGHPAAPSQPYPQQPSAPTQPYAQPPFGESSQPFPQPPRGEPSQPYLQPPRGEPSQPYQQPSPFAPPPGATDPAWARGASNSALGSQPAGVPTHPVSPAMPRPGSASGVHGGGVPGSGVHGGGVPGSGVHGGGVPGTAPGYVSGGIPEARLVESESSPIEQLADMAAEVPGRFMAFLKLSAKRAFRIRIEPTEVLPDERQLLLAANPPITDENLQAFLAWRRSVLFLVATSLTVLSIMGLIDSFNGYKVATSVRFVKLLPTLAELAFCLICWTQLRNWTVWRKQRRWLFIGWLLFMLTPFVVFMYPLSLVVADARHTLTAAQLRELGYDPVLVYNRVLAPFVFAMIALLQLAPKVISLMPGLIRSSMVIKLLFPGASAPGWLIVMAAPLYAMIFYAILIIPYQFSGSGWFIFGLLLVMIAQGLVTRSGFRLAKPLTQAEALEHISRVRKFYITLVVLGLLSIVGGLGLLVKLLHLKWTTVVTTVLKFETNVMILTTIGADLVVTNLDRARGYTEGKEHIEEETELKIAAFVGLNAPPTPPPSGPAQH